LRVFWRPLNEMRGGSYDAQRMAGFIDSLAQKGVEIRDLSSRMRNPIRFRLPDAALFWHRLTDRADA
jgi:hypothetical protein